MRLIITNKNRDINSFVYNYLPNYIYKLFIDTVEYDRLYTFDKELKLNTVNIISYLLKNLSISMINESTYDININKNLKVNGKSAASYLNFITYGNRSIKGYPIIYNIFKFIANNLDDIYENYKRGV